MGAFFGLPYERLFFGGYLGGRYDWTGGLLACLGTLPQLCSKAELLANVLYRSTRELQLLLFLAGGTPLGRCDSVKVLPAGG